ncbi:Cilia- and flagella-associated protein 251, partial [Cladochytrium tenue]
SLGWSFGLSTTASGGVHNLSDGTNRKCNEISVTAATSDRRWLMTADRGPNSVLIIWDTQPLSATREGAPGSAGSFRDRTMSAAGSLAGSPVAGVSAASASASSQLVALPIRTLFEVHDGHGVVAAEFSPDSRYLTLKVWDWAAADSVTPLCQIAFTGERQIPIIDSVATQKCVKINPENPFELVTNGDHSVHFLLWRKDGNVTRKVPIMNSKDFKHTPSMYTCSVFVPTTGQALTATTDGDVVVWAGRSLNNLSQELKDGQRAAVKLHTSTIEVLTVANRQFILTGGHDGFVKVFDLQFRLVQWFEKLKTGPIYSISLSSSNRPSSAKSEHGSVELKKVPEFVVATQQAKVFAVASCAINAGLKMSDDGIVTNDGWAGAEVDFDLVLQAPFGRIWSISSHPNDYLFAVGGDSGVLQLWNYSSKRLANTRLFETGPTEDKENSAVRPKNRKREGGPIPIRSTAFSSDGANLAVGFQDGTLRILKHTTLADWQDDGESPTAPGAGPDRFWSVSKEPVTHLRFSECGQFLAAGDAGFGVSVLRKEMVVGPRRQLDGIGEAIERLAAGKVSYSWVLVGRCQAHYKPIIGVLFIEPGPTDTNTRLLSASMDRHVAEYDLVASTVTRGVKLKSLKRIEQTAETLAVAYHPALHPYFNNPHQQHPASAFADAHLHAGPAAAAYSTKSTDSGSSNRLHSDPSPPAANTATEHPLSAERFLLVANDDLKLRFFNAATQFCRKTVLGPTFSGPVTALTVAPDLPTAQAPLVAYAALDRVVGLAVLPLDGNPHRASGVIAHPCKIAGIAFGTDSSRLLTAGVDDSSVHLWHVHGAALEAQIALGGAGIEPFLAMLDPSGLGADSPFYREMEDYFYYAQLRSQGEDAMSTRQIQDTLAVSEVPSVIQAMGYYPSEQDTDLLLNEVRYSSLDDGVLVDRVSFPDIIRLFVNHRPVFEYSEDDILDSLTCAARLDHRAKNPDEAWPAAAGRLDIDDEITKDGILALLQQYGESMSNDDVELAFRALLLQDPGRSGTAAAGLPDKLTAREMIEDVLGLQRVPAAAAAATAAAAQPQHGQPRAGGGGAAASSASSSANSRGSSAKAGRDGDMVGGGGVARVSSAGARVPESVTFGQAMRSGGMAQ